MNILFLVMSFLLICLFFNALTLKNTTFLSAKQSHVSSYHTSKLALQSKIERYKYKTYKQEHSKTKKQGLIDSTLSNVSIKEKKTFVSHRIKEVIPDLGKWNLAALCVADPKTAPLLIELTEKLFQSLYGHASFWQEAEKQIPHFSHKLVSSFLEKKEASTLSEIFPKDSQLQPAFYKMLQGSGFYSLSEHKGYPPLKDFCSFLEKNSSITNFPSAHLLIITTLFSQELSQEILTAEEEKWAKNQKSHSLTKEELKHICTGHSLFLKGIQFDQLEPFLQFSHQKNKKKKLTHKDQKTQIPLEISFPS